MDAAPEEKEQPDSSWKEQAKKMIQSKKDEKNRLLADDPFKTAAYSKLLSMMYKQKHKGKNFQSVIDKWENKNITLPEKQETKSVIDIKKTTRYLLGNNFLGSAKKTTDRTGMEILVDSLKSKYGNNKL